MWTEFIPEPDSQTDNIVETSKHTHQKDDLGDSEISQNFLWWNWNIDDAAMWCFQDISGVRYFPYHKDNNLRALEILISFSLLKNRTQV